MLLLNGTSLKQQWITHILQKAQKHGNTKQLKKQTKQYYIYGGGG